MADAGRLGDKANCPADSHGCPSCSHPVTGPAVAGSPNVYVNNAAALRVGDPGVHAACCGSNTWNAKEGAPTVFINGKAAYRKGDPSKHCGGMGKLIEGSPNVNIGNAQSPGSGPVPKLKLDFTLVLDNGAVISGEPFDVLDAEGNVVFSGITDDNGRAIFDDVPRVSYRVRTKSGFLFRAGR